MREKPRGAAISEILDPAHLAPTIIPRSKSLRSLVLPILTFNQTVTECLTDCRPALYKKPWPCDSLSAGAINFRDRDGVPNCPVSVTFTVGFQIPVLVVEKVLLETGPHHYSEGYLYTQR